MGNSKKKIDAIYELREAAEAKALAEKEATEHPSPHNRDELLDRRLTLEDKTVDAITACHECGQDHAPAAAHAR